MKQVTCNNCGWVHIGVTRTQAIDWVMSFNEFYDRSSKEIQEQYGRRSDISSYEKCFNCGNDYHNFRIAKEDDVPMGCTIQPIITDL